MSKALTTVIDTGISLEKTEVLFETPNAVLVQSDTLGKYILRLHDDLIVFQPCELISFRRKIQNIDLIDLLSTETPDIEIISLPHCDRIFVFSIHLVLELQELMSGAFTMIELNSMIHKEIIRKGALSKIF
ncbi:MAG: hypothetical protein ACFHWX_20710 [Bacteroidota bacterium]